MTYENSEKILLNTMVACNTSGLREAMKKIEGLDKLVKTQQIQIDLLRRKIVVSENTQELDLCNLL